MDTLFWMAVATVVVVLIFDYTNGFHDAANIVATVIASRAMTPVQAVLIVGFFEFMGPLLGGTAVANTIGKFVDLNGVDPQLAVLIMFCGLLGAIVWNLATWWLGIPSSSSHALVGGLAGAVVAAVGSEHVVWGFRELMTTGQLTGVTKVLLALFISPLLGFWVGFWIHRLGRRLLAGAKPTANATLRKLQFVTAAGLAFSHGANDAQKSMGMLTLVLMLGGFIPSFEVPFWVVLSCAAAITLGIMSGGWRIVRTLGFAIYRVRRYTLSTRSSLQRC
jgi:PiT family inorganic phosphate transporter